MPESAARSASRSLTMANFALRCIELHVACALLLALLKSVKYAGWDRDSGLSFDDAWLLVPVVLAVAIPWWTGLTLVACLGALLGWGVFLALWLDVILFRVFTIELGPGGVRTVVMAQLYRELSQISLARRFFREHRLFAGLPAAALCVFLPLEGRLRLIGLVALIGYLALASQSEVRNRVVPAMLCLLLVMVGAIRTTQVTGLLAPTLAALVLLALLSWFTRKNSPSLIREFLLPRPLPPTQSFEPRPEHQLLLQTPSAQVPEHSKWHGILKGSSVILVTVESMGMDYFSVANMPFLHGLKERSVHSKYHFCISPTTNNAHVALYAGDYNVHSTPGGLGALMDAGYQAVYLTMDDTAHYGLKSILRSAGFQQIIDRTTVGAKSPSDYVLMTQAVDRLEALLTQDAPVFLHVHTTSTHVPYHVQDPARFSSFNADDDYGRFMNGLEETDWVLSVFMHELARRKLLVEPLFVMTGDHGQAFGKYGYHSHGSAVTADQLNVPFFMHHPLLPPRSIGHSSHFDVVPTILDLLGLQAPVTQGQSLLIERGPPALFVHAGHPSRTSTSNFGLIDGADKYMIELITKRCYRMNWNDDDTRELEGTEKRYISALLASCLLKRGLV